MAGKNIINSSFFNRSTNLVAKELIGKVLIKKSKTDLKRLIVTETECYDGFRDKASHGSRGRTKRNQVMFGQPGMFYTYLCYGVHTMLNIVTREQGYPAAVLIRGGVAMNSKKNIILDGPGKLTRFFGISRKYNGKPARVSSGLWFEDQGMHIQKKHIRSTPRIGIAYAGKRWAAKKWRYVIDLRQMVYNGRKVASTR